MLQVVQWKIKFFKCVVSSTIANRAFRCEASGGMPLLCRNSMERAGSHPGVPGAAAEAVPPPGVRSSTCTSKQLIALPLILDCKNNKSVTEASNSVNSFRVFSHVMFNSFVLGLLSPSPGGEGENPSLGFSAGASLRGLGQAAKCCS